MPIKRRNRTIDNKPLFEQKKIGAYFVLFEKVSVISAGYFGFRDMLESELASLLEQLCHSVYSHGNEYKIREMDECLY
ncbi:hypothetical protein AZE41_17645 [Sporosarcina psychrophila]|nr:hypothetical protein AZE41_17645 [Sporosarcina psychrophila]